MSRVQKLDDPSVFNEIKTGMTSTSSLPGSNVQQMNVWFNHFKSTGEIKLPRSKIQIGWVGTHHKVIHKYLLDTYKPPKYQYSTLRFHLEALANILLAIDKKKYKEITRPMWNKALEHQKDIDEQRKENKLTDREIENFVCFQDIVKIRDEYHDKWVNKRKDKRLNMYHLILAMNTYNPPMRLNIVGMEIWTGKKEPPDDVETNYLWKKPDGNYEIIINHDKIENKRRSYAKKKGYNYKRQSIKLYEEIPGVTDGKRLQSLIDQSLQYFPREYVLAGVRTQGSPMGKTSYDKAFETIFKPIGKRPTQNLIRKSYVNHWYRLGAVSSKKLEEIAKRMRHSVSIAMLSYVKVNIDCDKPQVRGDVLPERIEIEAPKKKTEYFNAAKYAKQCRQKHGEKIKVQRRANYQKNKDKILMKKVLWNLNHKSTAMPRKDTVDKYKLKYDPREKRWTSDLE